MIQPEIPNDIFFTVQPPFGRARREVGAERSASLCANQSSPRAMLHRFCYHLTFKTQRFNVTPVKSSFGRTSPFRFACFPGDVSAVEFFNDKSSGCLHARKKYSDFEVTVEWRFPSTMTNNLSTSVRVFMRTPGADAPANAVWPNGIEGQGKITGCNNSSGYIGLQSEGGWWEARKVTLEPMP